MGNRELGDLPSSELLILELYIELRKKVNAWAEITSQTAQARMGYVGQHLVSVVTGYPGGKSGARGKDLLISHNRYAEIKTCYRVDQLGKCNSCGVVVASIEKVCPSCNSTDIKRNDDSKWLIGIRNDAELETILEPAYFYLVLFDFLDLSNPNVIRASIWQVAPTSPGFAYCMIDYYLNIRAKSKSKAPFNLWPFQLKFYLMKPVLIYRSIINADDSIQTQIFPKRDAPVIQPISPLRQYSRSPNLTKEKVLQLADYMGIAVDKNHNKTQLLSAIDRETQKKGTSEAAIADVASRVLYYPQIELALSDLPKMLHDRLNTIHEQIRPLIDSFH